MVISLLAIRGAHADDLTRANSAFDRREYSRAFELYEPLATSGNASAESAIGSMYYFGNGVGKNWARAYMWFSLAARSTSAIATVARTNRDVIARRMASGDIDLAQFMTDQCLTSHYQNCGLPLASD